jgi:hypothetical protein
MDSAIMHVLRKYRVHSSQNLCCRQDCVSYNLISCVPNVASRPIKQDHEFRQPKLLVHFVTSCYYVTS